MTKELATAPEVVAFIRSAEAFRRLLDERRTFDDARALTMLARSIAELYAASLMLPNVEPTGNDAPPEVSLPSVAVVGAGDVYWEVYDPYEEGNLVCGSLTDDIKDIYRDIVEGLLLFHRGEVENAVWSWRFHRQYHWGDHAVDALRALQRLIGDGEV